MTDITAAPIIAQAALETIDGQYDTRAFAEKHGISVHKAREILSLAGDSREKADRMIEKSRKV